MSNVISIQQFLVGKTLTIPLFQRDYSWTTKQVEDLFGDIKESISTNSPHYLGTVVLAHVNGDRYEVVDGQQRLSTLALIIHALLTQLPNDDTRRIEDTAILLRQDDEMKLNFGNNAHFVSSLLSAARPFPTTAGQRKLDAAYRYARERADEIFRSGGRPLIIRYLATIRRLEIIEFVASDTGRAITLFQTVNDRGLLLSAMDKAKALLVLYSNRHLGREFDRFISDCFGRCYAAFDAMKVHVEKKATHIGNIARDGFSEDDLLRYHYLAYDFPGTVEGADWDGSIRTVFDSFLKKTLAKFAKEDSNKLHSFIQDYVEDLVSFCEAFRDLVLETGRNARIYRYLVILGASARLYPLTVRLYQRGILFNTPAGSTVDLLQALETCDVRVYKTRGTEPAAGIGQVSHASRNAAEEVILEFVRAFTASWMSDGLFSTLLGQDMYRNQALTLIMLDYDEHCAGTPYPIGELHDLVEKEITREHILSQVPNFSVIKHGFIDDDDFAAHLHLLGNLTPLTKSENSICGNSTVEKKMTNQDLYLASHYSATRQLANHYIVGNSSFNKTELLQRTKYLSQWILKRWSLA